jgi:hypothetical protein
MHRSLLHANVLRITGNMDVALCNTEVFLAYYPYFEKIKVGLCDHHAVCVSVLSPPPHHQLWNA